jgi:hypothetical protein
MLQPLVAKTSPEPNAIDGIGTDVTWAFSCAPATTRAAEERIDLRQALQGVPT